MKTIATFTRRTFTKGMGGAARIGAPEMTAEFESVKSIEKKGKKKGKSKKEKKNRKKKKKERNSKKNDNSDGKIEDMAKAFCSRKRKLDVEHPENLKRAKTESLKSEEDHEADGIVVTRSDDNTIELFGMSDITIETLKKKGVESLFDIQAATFKLLRYENKDVIAHAQTDSGKTLAFVLPIVENIIDQSLHKCPRNDKPIALCLAPTRELPVMKI